MSSTTNSPDAADGRRHEMRMITRAAAVLRALAEGTAGQSLGQLAKATGLPRSTIQRIVGALEAERLVSADGAAPGVRLGPEIARLGAAVHRDVTHLFKPHLERLHAEVEATIDLTMLQGDAAVVIDQIASARPLRVVSHVGTALPLHCTASGKAHLVQLGERQARALLKAPLRAYTAGSETRIARVLASLCVGEPPVSVDKEEFAIGVCAIALPLKTVLSGHYAVSVSMPKPHFDAQFPLVCSALRRCQAAIEKATGMV